MTKPPTIVTVGNRDGCSTTALPHAHAPATTGVPRRRSGEPSDIAQRCTQCIAPTSSNWTKDQPSEIARHAHSASCPPSPIGHVVAPGNQAQRILPTIYDRSYGQLELRLEYCCPGTPEGDDAPADCTGEVDIAPFLFSSSLVISNFIIAS